MSRLESFIRRMQAQKACLDWAVNEIADLPGVIGELGLGNGRTYDHLREKLPDRDIIVFERKLAAHPDCIPPDEMLFLGEIGETLPRTLERYEGALALVHYDMGTGVPERNAAQAARLAPDIRALMKRGGLLIADHAVPVADVAVAPLPEGVAEGRYFLYRAV